MLTFYPGMEKTAVWSFQAANRVAGMAARVLYSQKPYSPVADIEPKRLTIVDQWARLTAILKGAAACAEEAVECHASATMQLDLAQYALTSLVDDLSAVMNLGGRQRRATVYVFGPAQPLSSRESMAA